MLLLCGDERVLSFQQRSLVLRCEAGNLVGVLLDEDRPLLPEPTLRRRKGGLVLLGEARELLLM